MKTARTLSFDCPECKLSMKASIGDATTTGRELTVTIAYPWAPPRVVKLVGDPDVSPEGWAGTIIQAWAEAHACSARGVV